MKENKKFCTNDLNKIYISKKNETTTLQFKVCNSVEDRFTCKSGIIIKFPLKRVYKNLHDLHSTVADKLGISVNSITQILGNGIGKFEDDLMYFDRSNMTDHCMCLVVADTNVYNQIVRNKLLGN
jgi:hypothetical protein